VTIGSVNAKLDGMDVQLLIAPQVLNGRTMMGVRDLANLFGASLVLEGNKITLTID
jgi:hypothetical protein